MAVDQDIEPGQLYKDTDTDKSFKVLDVRTEIEQVRVLYLDDINSEQLVDTRGRIEVKLIDTIRRQLAEGRLVRVSDDPYSNPGPV